MSVSACLEPACGRCETGRTLQGRVLERDGWHEVCFADTQGAGVSPAASLNRLAACLRSAHAHLVELDLFGDAAWIESAVSVCAAQPELRNVPATVLECPAGGGWLARAVAGRQPEPVAWEGRVLGYHLRGARARHCWLGGVVAADLQRAPAAQTRAVLETVGRALETVGMDFGCVARTWFYLDDILGWYGDFNRARTAFFQEHRVFDGLMPASTGIGTPNAAGAALVAKAHAVLPRDGKPMVRRAESPLQGEALAYGSAFNRAVEIVHHGSRTLHISGTASIAADGKLLHLDSLRDQVALTLRVVEAILRRAGLDWSDAVRGIAYFRDAPDLALWEECREASGVPPLPVVAAECVVCWPGLLFELELEAGAS